MGYDVHIEIRFIFIVSQAEDFDLPKKILIVLMI